MLLFQANLISYFVLCYRDSDPFGSDFLWQWEIQQRQNHKRFTTTPPHLPSSRFISGNPITREQLLEKGWTGLILGAGVSAPLSEYLPCIHETLGLIPGLTKLGMVVHACSPNIWIQEVMKRGAEVRGHPQLYGSLSEVRLVCRTCFRKKIEKAKFIFWGITASQWPHRLYVPRWEVWIWRSVLASPAS